MINRKIYFEKNQNAIKQQMVYFRKDCELLLSQCKKPPRTCFLYTIQPMVVTTTNLKCSMIRIWSMPVFYLNSFFIITLIFLIKIQFWRSLVLLCYISTTFLSAILELSPINRTKLRKSNSLYSLWWSVSVFSWFGFLIWAKSRKKSGGLKECSTWYPWI